MSAVENQLCNALHSSAGDELSNAVDSSAQARRAWSRRYLSRCAGPLPLYGSPEWAALPDTAPEKVASCVAAAEREAIGRQLEAMQLQAELEYADARFKAAEDDAWAAAGQAHRAAWDGRTGRFRPDPQIAAEVASDWRAWVGEHA